MGYEYRGRAYLEVGQQQAAIADFTKAISVDPDAIYGYSMRGRAYYFLNQFDSAMADFQAALRIDPNDSDTISYINDLRRKQRGRLALRGCEEPARVQDVLLEDGARRVDFDQRHVIAPEIGKMLKHALGVRLAQLGALHDRMAQHQAPIARKIDVDHFDVGVDEPDVVLPRQFTTNPPIAAFIVDGIDPDAGAFRRIVMQMKHSQVSDQPRAEELRDETFIAVVGPDIAQYRHHVAGSGNIREPFAILVVRIGDDALDVLHHREAERIGVETRKALIVEVRLKYHIGVRLQEFEEIAVGNPPLFMQAGHDAVMHVGRGALVHHFALGLRIEILRDVPHDPKQFALPGLQARRRLLQEIQQIFLGQPKQHAPPF